MIIYNNRKVNPKVYQPRRSKKVSTNQEIFKLNYLHSILEEQARMNQSLNNSVKIVNHSIDQNRISQNRQLQHVVDKLEQQGLFSEQIQTFFQNQQENNDLLMERISTLEKNLDVLTRKLESDSILTQAILDQQASQDTVITKLTTHLEEQAPHWEKLTQQEERYEDISKKLDLQEVFHTTVMERLDKQEGLLTKLKGELDHLRSVLYERATHIVDKMESHFSRITKPFQSFFINTSNHKGKTENSELDSKE